jgi:hypothetical protein
MIVELLVEIVETGGSPIMGDIWKHDYFISEP